MLAPWKESYEKPRQSIKRQKHYFVNKGTFTQSYGFPVVIKKAEHKRTDALEMWCWRRLLQVPWTIRRSNQSTHKEINPEYLLEGLLLKLKLQDFVHLMQRACYLEKTLMLGKIEDRRRG